MSASRKGMRIWPLQFETVYEPGTFMSVFIRHGQNFLWLEKNVCVLHEKTRDL